MNFQLTKKSRNEKTGPIPVSTSSAETCPASCPFKNNGCYAGAGPISWNWKRVTNGERGDKWGDFLKAINALKPNQLWRHNQAGDLPGVGEELDTVALGQLVEASKGKRGFTYTHKPLNTKIERAAIKSANDNGFTINISANSLEDVDKMVDMNIGPVVTVLDGETTENQVTAKGRKVVVCPATIRDDLSCATCKLCSVADRSVVVGFPAHGAQKKKASLIAVGG